ncbi:MAG TPA: aldo/keto reductase [Candidatus Binatia bacterium]|jgi:diketogulonate reductase-like aldo/keto reductase
MNGPDFPWLLFPTDSGIIATAAAFRYFRNVEFKELAATGIKIPEIGLGTWDYRGGAEPLKKAIELGAFLIDTAEMYGTEEAVGAAIKGMRQKVFIATKVSGNHLRYDDVLRAAENSLKQLGTETIDLYQLHWPDPAVPLADTMGAMEILVDAGKVRFIGVSNFYLKNLQDAEACMTKHKIVSNQVKYSLLQRGIEEDMLPYCQKNRITVIAYSPLARGDLSAKPLLRNRRALGVLQQISAAAGKTMAQVALNWCISKPNVVAIPKTDKVERVVEACEASGWRLSPAQIAALERAFPA